MVGAESGRQTEAITAAEAALSEAERLGVGRVPRHVQALLSCVV
jgi:hypothetical protein